jgi:sugar O-acyltransferase (sialic acid O-acetyltransferase NeuD family)
MSKFKKILILGCGGHGKVVAEIAHHQKKWGSVSFLDDKFPSLDKVLEWAVIGKIADLVNFSPKEYQIALGIGNNTTRLSVLNQVKLLGFETPAIIHPKAIVSDFCNIGEATIISAGSIVNAGSIVKSGVILNSQCVIEHDCIIENGVHISPGAILCGEVFIGERTWVGAGAIIKHQVRINSDITIGAGAAVVSNLAEASTYVGVPAKKLIKGN